MSQSLTIETEGRRREWVVLRWAGQKFLSFRRKQRVYVPDIGYLEDGQLDVGWHPYEQIGLVSRETMQRIVEFHNRAVVEIPRLRQELSEAETRIAIFDTICTEQSRQIMGLETWRSIVEPRLELQEHLNEVKARIKRRRRHSIQSDYVWRVGMPEPPIDEGRKPDAYFLQEEGFSGTEATGITTANGWGPAQG